jgi:hypothetical protein
VQLAIDSRPVSASIRVFPRMTVLIMIAVLQPAPPSKPRFYLYGILY